MNTKDQILGQYVVSKSLTKSWRKAKKIAESQVLPKYDKEYHCWLSFANDDYDWKFMNEHFGVSDILEDMKLKLMQPELLKENWYFLIMGFMRLSPQKEGKHE